MGENERHGTDDRHHVWDRERQDYTQRYEMCGERMVEFEPRQFENIDSNKRPSLLAALIPTAAVLLFLSIGIAVFDMDPQFPLFWGIAFTGLFTRYYLGFSWEKMYEGMVDGIFMGIQALLIILIVYTLIATWIQAGTIPGIMYYGLDWLTPVIFLPLTAILGALVSFAIGSSWTTAGTLGVAFIGIGSGLGIPAPMTAGAVITGAYTGDKQSPMSDSTNLAAAATNTDLYDHIDAMRVGTLMSFLISVVLYAILGLNVTGEIPTGRVNAIQGVIESSYSLTPLVFLPLILVFALAIYGIPALPTLGAGVFAGALVSMFAQGTGFVAVWTAAQSGTSPPETQMELVNGLLESSGLIGAAWPITIAIAAFALGGMLDRTGILAVLAHNLGRLCRGVTSLTGVTAVSAIMTNALTAEKFIGIVFPGMALQNIYDEYGLKSKNLSRAIESSGTTSAALIPWTTGGVFMAGALGVPTLSYAPYYFFGYISPLVLMAITATGWQIEYKDREEPTSVPSTDESTPSTAVED